jgi:hypothetical protein
VSKWDSRGLRTSRGLPIGFARIREGAEYDLRLLNQNLIAELIMEINAAAGKKDADSKLYYPDAFLATNYKNWIKKVENYLNYQTGKAGVPLSYMI